MLPVELFDCEFFGILHKQIGVNCIQVFAPQNAFNFYQNDCYWDGFRYTEIAFRQIDELAIEIDRQGICQDIELLPIWCRLLTFYFSVRLHFEEIQRKKFEKKKI